GEGRWCRRCGGREATRALSEFVLVGKHPIAAINVTSAKRFWRLLQKTRLHLGFVGAQACKPRFGQPMIVWISHPGWAGETRALTQVFHGGSTKDSPLMQLCCHIFRLLDWVLHQFLSPIRGIPKPIVQE